MPSITLHPKPLRPLDKPSPTDNPLPNLLQTPSGLAVVEVQGTFNLPRQIQDAHSDNHVTDTSKQTTIGRLVFPLYNANHPDDTAWMKRVYLYIGKHQRMTGEVKKLSNPLAIIQKRQYHQPTTETMDHGQHETIRNPQQDTEDLEIVDIVRYKILFASRPEPVGVEQS